MPPRLIEVESYAPEDPHRKLWTAEIWVYNHRPVFYAQDNLSRFLTLNSYESFGPLTTVLGTWTVAFSSYHVIRDPAMLCFEDLRFSSRSPEGPFEAPRRANYKLPPGWHWAQCLERWCSDNEVRASGPKLLRVRELRNVE